MKLGFEQSSVVASMAHFEQSSVIKTAPPGRGGGGLDFSPKNTEPLDLAPLTQPNLQDLSKMQPIEYYQAYPRVYSEYIGLGGPTTQSSLISAAPSTAGNIYYPSVFPNAVTQSDWSRPMETHYSSYQRGSTLQYAQQEPAQERVYKVSEDGERRASQVEMPSPVDSGIGADLSLMQNSKEEFYQSSGEALPGLERGERALSHRDSPIIIPKL